MIFGSGSPATRSWVVALFALCLTVQSVEALAAGLADPAPSAVVEEVSENVSAISAFEFLVPGRVIELGSKGRIVIGYLENCARETVTGGQLIVGRTASAVTGGTVSIESVECDGGGLLLTAKNTGKSAVVVFRKPPVSAARPTLTIYGLSPIFAAPGSAGSIVVNRLDRSGPSLTLTLAGGFADMGVLGDGLQPGGVYSVELAKRTIIFRVDDRAKKSSAVSMLSRLIRF